MKTLIATLAAAAAVTAAVPAAAHPVHNDYGRYERGHVGYNINARQHELNRMIENGVRRGALTRREANQLHWQSEKVTTLERQYRRGGLSPRERAILDRRLDRLEFRIVANLRDGERRYGYGYGHRR